MFAGETLTASGWGSVNPDINIPEYPTELKATKLLGFTQVECQSKYDGYNINEKAHICAFGSNTGICKGDSGGNNFLMICGNDFSIF